MIFGVIDTLITDGATEEQKKLAVALGVVGARLPHGQRDATIEKLIALAPRQARANLLLSLVFSGEEIDVKLVADGIAETFEAAKKEAWILTESGAYQLRAWLRLLSFATPLSEVPAVVRAMPNVQCNPHLLEEVVGGLGHLPSVDAEEVLFKLAEDAPHLYLNYEWRAVALSLGTVSSARRLIELTANGTLSHEISTNDWHWQHELSNLISKFSDVRARVRELLKDGPASKPLAFLAHAVAEDPGMDGLLMLIDFEIKTGHSFLTWRSIESAVTKHVSYENWKNTYNVVPVPAMELRQKLLAMTTNCDANDPAARCLNYIDKLRDKYGAPETEPRHPDLASGRAWPIVTSDPIECEGDL
jgi:hypothetical protein